MLTFISGVLNVCSPYTSRDEITTALRDTVQEVYDGSLPLRFVYLQLSTQRRSLLSSSEPKRPGHCLSLDCILILEQERHT